MRPRFAAGEIHDARAVPLRRSLDERSAARQLYVVGVGADGEQVDGHWLGGTAEWRHGGTMRPAFDWCMGIQSES